MDQRMPADVATHSVVAIRAVVTAHHDVILAQQILAMVFVSAILADGGME
jgi:hypothetical protein